MILREDVHDQHWITNDIERMIHKSLVSICGMYDGQRTRQPIGMGHIEIKISYFILSSACPLHLLVKIYFQTGY